MQNKCYPKGVYLPISKLLSILSVANLLAHNNKSQICYCGQISLQSAAVNCTFSDTFGGNIIYIYIHTHTRIYIVFYIPEKGCALTEITMLYWAIEIISI